ncbi:MAG: hypothetical protein ACLP7P_07790 [Rhodomicrobium sp.]
MEVNLYPLRTFEAVEDRAIVLPIWNVAVLFNGLQVGIASFMSFYNEYKPLRNYMRQFDLLQSLVDVWHYSLHVMEGHPLAADYAVGRNPLTSKLLEKHPYPWEFDILVKELVLSAGKRGDRSLKKWHDLTVAINHLRRLDDAAFLRGSEEPVDALLELHRIAHRQLPWQMKVGVGPMMRAFKVFGEAEVEKIVQRELAMTTRQFLLLGMAVGGHFLKHWGMSTDQDYGVLGISKDVSTAFFSRITCSLKQLKAETAKYQSYDRDWLYTWNPLQATPLVSLNPACPEKVLCPIPRYLIHRVSDGIFYDLVRAAGFDNPFGHSFQAYIGAILQATCLPPRFTVLAEEPYYVGNNKMHGADWVLSDSTGHLFIECKTKRLTVNAKALSDSVALDKDLIVMATAIVQHYRNIRDALNGKTRWVPNRLPVYPLVLTLEDWLIFSPQVNEMLIKHVRHLLVEANLPDQVLEEMPYTIASAHEFEIVSQVIAQVSISPLMARKTEQGIHRIWSLLPFISDQFKEEMRNVNWRLFTDDWEKLMPDMPGVLAT